MDAHQQISLALHYVPSNIKRARRKNSILATRNFIHYFVFTITVRLQQIVWKHYNARHVQLVFPSNATNRRMFHFEHARFVSKVRIRFRSAYTSVQCVCHWNKMSLTWALIAVLCPEYIVKKSLTISWKRFMLSLQVGWVLCCLMCLYLCNLRPALFCKMGVRFTMYAMMYKWNRVERIYVWQHRFFIRRKVVFAATPLGLSRFCALHYSVVNLRRNIGFLAYFLLIQCCYFQ